MGIAHMAKVMFSEFLSCPQGGGGGGWVLGKVHYEHILGTKVLMPVGGGGGGVWGWGGGGVRDSALLR